MTVREKLVAFPVREMVPEIGKAIITGYMGIMQKFCEQQGINPELLQGIGTEVICEVIMGTEVVDIMGKGLVLKFDENEEPIMCRLKQLAGIEKAN